jgi:glycolate oxidase FAD binding subunit
VQAPRTLDLSALAGVVLYEPDELVLSARSGTPLAEVERLLAEHRQHLAFEPVDLGPLGGHEAGAATLGGAIACNLAGPRRIKSGAARDHVLGAEAITGRGDRIKVGGRVVKNVTGYDLCKILAGSYGTLAVMTEVTVKVVPAPEETLTLVLYGLDDRAAIGAMSLALGSHYEVSGAAHLPPQAAAAIATVGTIVPGDAAATVLRLEGFGPSVAFRAERLSAELAPFGGVARCASAASIALWRDIRDARPFVAQPNRLVWRLSVPPAAGAEVVARIVGSLPADVYYDWGGGLVWLSPRMAAAKNGGLARDGGAGVIRTVLAATSGGHATLVRAPETLRAAVEVFQPQPEPLAGLTARVKDSFDPKRLLNPGRMYAGL